MAFSLSELVSRDVDSELDARAALEFGEINPRVERRREIKADARRNMLGSVMLSGTGSQGLGSLGQMSSPNPVPSESTPDIDPVLFRQLRGM